MSIVLSSADLEKLAVAVQLLVTPLDFASVDEWRSAVNRHLRELLRADSAGFLLPVSEGLMLYSEEHDPKELAAYPEVIAPGMADGTPMWEQMVRSGVDTLPNTYGRDYHRYLESEYYNDYAGKNGAHDTLFAAMPLWGVDATSMAGLHFWHSRPDGERFGEREVALLRILFPAFRAGVEAQVRWGGHRSDLLSALDALEQAVLVCDLAGRVVHQTPRLGALLDADAEATLLRLEMLAVMDAVRGAAAGAGPGRPIHPAPAVARETRTGSGRYMVRGSLYGGGSSAQLCVLVALERHSAPAPKLEPRCREFGLTPAEARVACLIAQGRGNAAIAAELFISPHTARRHTEQILKKLNVRSRAEVGPKLRS